MTCTTLSMVYIGLGSFLLRVVLRESSIDVEERYVRALDVIQAMVNMVLGGHGRSFGPPRFDGPRFPPRGGRPQRRSDFVDVAHPTFEQMARHWYNTCFSNPSVGAFAHSSRY